ncbi:MAG: hypothetical protein EP329_20105 [Deltaproteobacteria bacterium]|nr:MAG: hypothetical protein EP329_20105 [Deltaproteobacteria bacterium]
MGRHLRDRRLSALPLVLAALVGLAALGAPSPARAQGALCAKVKLEIPQRLTLERDAFEARLVMSNNLTDLPLEDIAITLEIATAEGQDAATLIFVGDPSLSGVTAIDGSGRVAAAGTAEIQWLFVPTPGAGGQDPAGLSYRARAHLHYRAGGVESDLASTWADFTVYPQPLLDLVYALPRWVDADDPFTAPVEPPVPFDLALRIANAGYGPARAVKVASAQPRIVDNAMGLLIDFEIVASEVDGRPASGSLLVDVGDIDPGACKTGAWIMKTTLSGAFTEMGVTFSHADALGGADTSLIASATTRWLLRRVRAQRTGPLPDIDQQDDLLVEPADAPPTASGLPLPDGYALLQSSCVEDPVTRVVGALAGTPSEDTPDVVVTAELLAGFNLVVVDDPLAGAVPVRQAVRLDDGQPLHAKNAWVGRERDEGRRLFVLDWAASGGTRQYQVGYAFDAMDVAPPVTDLAAASGPVSRDGNTFAAAPWTIFTAVSQDDLSGVASIEMRLDGGDWASLSPFFFDAGVHEVELRATDGRGNVETPRVFQVVIDTAPPVITVTAPVADGAFGQDGIPVAFEVGDDVPGAAVVATLRPVGEDVGVTVASGQSYGPPALAWGTYELVVTATDWLAQEATVVVGPLALRPATPTIAFTSPEDGQVSALPLVVAVEASGDGLAPVALTVDGAAHASGEPFGAEGAHTARAEVSDVAGQHVAAERSFTIDTTAPVVTITGAEPNTTHAPGLVPGIGVEDATATTLAVTLDGAPYTPGTPIAAVGDHTLVATATDAAGNVGEASASFVVAWPDAEVTLTVTLGGEPLAGARVWLLNDDAGRTFTGVAGTTDADGRVTLVAPEHDGTWRARVDRPTERRFAGPWTLVPGHQDVAVPLPAEQAFDRELHVAAGASPDAADGSTQHPYASLEAAFGAIDGAGFGTRVRVAHGDYTLSGALAVPEGVVVTGGYDPETFAPDPEGEGTALHGAGGAAGLVVDGVVHAVVGELAVVGEPALSGAGGAPLLHDVRLEGAAGDAVSLSIVGALEVDNALVLGAVTLSGGVSAVGATARFDAATFIDGGLSASLGVHVTVRHAISADAPGAAFSAFGEATVALSAVLVGGAVSVTGGDGEISGAGGVISADPGFVDGPRHLFYLAQGAVETQSPAVDAGMVAADAHPTAGRTTDAVTQAADSGLLDLGYHAWAAPTQVVADGDGEDADVVDDVAEDTTAADTAVVEDTQVVEDTAVVEDTQVVEDTGPVDTHVEADTQPATDTAQGVDEGGGGGGCGSCSGAGGGQGAALPLGLLVLAWLVVRRRRRLARRLVALLAVALPLAAAAPSAHAAPEVTLGSQSFRAYYADEPDVALFSAPAVERLQAASTFYNYCSASSHTGFELKGRSLFFFYRDVRATANPDVVSLILTHGVDAAGAGCHGTGGQGSATVQMRITGVPAVASVSVSDDAGELKEPSPGRFEGNWAFADNTDGGVISNIPTDQDWTVCVEQRRTDAQTAPAWTGDMSQWQYYFGGGADVTLDPARQVCIKYKRPLAPDTVGVIVDKPLTICGHVEDPAGVATTADIVLDWADPEDPGAVVTETIPTATVTCWTHTYTRDTRYEPDGTLIVDLTATIAGESASDQIAVIVGTGELSAFDLLATPTTVVAGTPLTLTATAIDDLGDPRQSYTGTVTLGADDTGATLPDPWTYDVAELGTHAFTGVVLTQAGEQQLYASDLGAFPVVTTATAVTVLPAAADAAHGALAVVPDPPVADGAGPVTVTLTLRDAWDNLVDTAAHAVGLTVDQGSVGAVSVAGEGRWTAAWTPPASAGTATFTVTLGGAAFFTAPVTLVADTTPPPGVQPVVSVPGEDTLTVTWPAVPVPDLDHYELRWAPTGQAPGDAVVIPAGTTTGQATGLTACTNYDVTLAAVDHAGNVGPAVSVTGRTVAAGPPVAPPNLIGEAGDGWDILTWDATPSCDAAGYAVYRRTLPDGAYALLADGLVLRSFTDFDAPNGQSYGYVVRTRDAEGLTSADSNEVVLSPVAAPPAPAVSGLTAVAGPARRVTLDWQLAAQADHYLVYRAPDSLDPEALPEPIAPAYTAHFVDAAPADGVFAYTVVAVDAFDKASLAAAPVTVTADGTVPTAAVALDPAPPYGLTSAVAVTLTASEDLGGTPTLAAIPPTGAPVPIPLESAEGGAAHFTGTLVFPASPAEGTWRLSWSGADLLGQVGNGAPIPGIQTFAVDFTPPTVAVDVRRLAAPGDALDVTLTSSEALAEAPTLQLVVANLGPIDVVLDGADDYWTGVLALPQDAASGPAQLTVAATDLAGNVTTTLADPTLVIDGEPPAAPPSVLVTARSQGRLRVLWQSPASGTGEHLTYALFRSADVVAGQPTTADEVASDLILTLYEDLPPSDGTWWYAVQATDEVGNVGPLSAWISGVSDQTAPGAPTGLTATLESGRVRLTWQAPAGEAPASYVVRRAVGGDAPEIIATGLTATTTLDLPETDGEYSWTVTALDAVANASAPSAPATLLFDERPPTIRVTGVSDGDVLAAPVLVVVTATDATAVTLSAVLDGATFTLGTVVSDEGPHTLVVTATDAGQRESEVTVHFTLDLTDPVVTLAGVTAGATVHTAPALSWTVDDATAVTVVAKLDGQGYAEGSDVTAEGPHTLVVTATDAAGNTGAASVSFTVDLPPPVPTALEVVVDLDAGEVGCRVPSAPADVTEVHYTRDGTLIATAAPGVEVACGEPPSGALRGAVSALLVDAGGQQGAPRRVEIYGVGVALGDYGRAAADGGRELVRWMLDAAPVVVTSADLQGLIVSRLRTTLGDDLGATWFDHVAAGSRSLPAAGEVTWPATVHSHRELTDAATLDVALDVAAPGADPVTYRRGFDVAVGWPTGETVHFESDHLWLGAAGQVTLSVQNQGTAPLALKTRTAAGANAGEVKVRVTSVDGLDTWATLQVGDAGLPTVQTGAGRFVVIPAGETVRFPTLSTTVPPDAGTQLRLAADLTKFYGDVTSTAPFGVVGHGGEGYADTSPPPYTASLAAPVTDLPMGGAATLTGEVRDADGAPVGDVPVKIRVRRGSFEERHTVLAAGDGTFSYDWTPLPRTAGRFRFSADHPAVTAFSADATVDVWGLLPTVGTFALTLPRGVVGGMSASFRNPGDRPLGGLTVELSEGPGDDGVEVALRQAAPTSLGAEATLSLALRVTAAEDANAHVERTLTVRTAEGAEATAILSIDTVGAVAVPRVEPALMRFGLRAGDLATKRFLVRNVGYAVWRGVTVTPPDGSLVAVTSAAALGDLAPGEGRTVDLTVSVPPGTATGSQYGGHVVIAGTDGVSTALPVGVSVVTDLEGSALVEVRDLTEALTNPDAPVAGAKVTLVSLDGSALVNRTATTDAAGDVAFVGLPAGSYRYKVTASGYASVDGADGVDGNRVVEIVAGDTALVEVGLVRSPVSLDFTVTPTTITDDYDITVTATYASSVPAPMLTAIPAEVHHVLSGGETETGELTLYNAGLASAWHVRIRPRDSTYVKLAYAVDQVDEIPAHGQLTIPYTVHLKSHGSPPPPICGPQCTDVYIDSEWYCNTAGLWVKQGVWQRVCVDVPPCKIQSNRPQVTRIQWIGCPNPDGAVEPLCIKNMSGGEMKMCNCGMVTAQGIGLASLSDALLGMVYKTVAKIETLGLKLIAGIIPADEEATVESVATALSWAKQAFDDGKQLVDMAEQQQCDQEGLGDQIQDRLMDGAAVLAEETTRQVLSKWTGGILKFEGATFAFDKTCLANGEETCADPGAPDYSLGVGGMNFCVQCGSCTDPAQQGDECPMVIPFADITVYCGPGVGGRVEQHYTLPKKYDIPKLPVGTDDGTPWDGGVCEPGTIAP